MLHYILCASLLLTLLKTEGALLHSRFYIGPTLVHFLYDNTTTSTCQVALVGTSGLDTSEPSAWFQCLYQNATTPYPTCRQTSQTQIIWGPIGCSNIVSPETAIQSGNCISSEAELQRRLSIFLNTFYLSKESLECYQLGGQGDIRLCPGPLRLSIPNQDPLIPIAFPRPTVDYIASQQAFIEGGTGYQAMFPYVFEVPLIWPKITLTGATGCDSTYNGNYLHWERDPSDLIFSMVSRSFIHETTTTLRLLLKRVDDESLNFQIVLADITGPAGDLFDFQWVSGEFVGDSDTVFTNWVYQIPWNTEIPMYPYPSGSEACQIFLQIPETYTPELGPVPELTTSDYMLNQQPRRYFKSSVCNYKVCRPDDIGYEFYPNCPIGTKFGGDAVASHPLYPGLPVYVAPNPRIHYRLDCTEFYPVNATFRAYNINPSQGATVYRTVIESEICNAPFIDTESITNNLNPNERYLQCQKMNGWVEANGLYCSVSITGQSPCPLNWHYWDQRCFYKFNPQTDLRFQSTLENAQETCASLNPFAKALVEVDRDTDSWLRRFMYLNTALDAPAAFRTPSFDTAYCNCYLSPPFDQNSTIAPCGCFDTTVLNTYRTIFPLCYFPISTVEMEPEWVDIEVSLQTAALLRYGQQGPNMGGFELQCQCFNGITFSRCTTTTCEVDVTAGDDIGVFQRKCMEGEGQCPNNINSLCQCPPGRGPSASLLSSLGELYANREWPCGCPASGRERGLYKINNQTYGGVIQDVLYLPCDGVDHGVCIISNNTNFGTCVSVLRPNLQTGLDEAAYSGVATSCPNPIQPYKAITQNGPITTQFCNSKGTCCPGGQTNDNPNVGDPYTEKCFTSDGSPLTGCECETGSGGPSCVCPTPLNLAEGRLPQTTTISDVNYVFIDLEQAYFIRALKLSSECNIPTEAQITNEVGKGPPSTLACVFNVTQGVYDCPESLLAYQYVSLQGFELTQSCKIEAFLSWFTLCGQNGTGNPFAGRFFDIPQYRARDRNLEEQFVGVANLGCTSTECMCNSEWTGPGCATGVSSIRPTYIEGEATTLDTKFVCGENTLVPSYDNPVQGRGQLDPIYKNCSCNPLSVSDLTGLLGDPLGEERFAGRGCQCAMIKNIDRDELLLCAGHGECENPSFALGWCEKPLDDLSRDSLSRPYADQIDFTIELVTDVIVTETSYVIGDYIYTTSSPTNYPTRSPTNSPTEEPTAPTNSPTKSPTNPTNSPTFSPTSPTNSPTLSPTTPTNSPTSPTSSPTAPTNSPTSSPTLTPYVIFFAADSQTGKPSTTPTSPTVCSPAKPPTCTPTSVYQYRTTTKTPVASLPFSPTKQTIGPNGGVLGTWDSMVISDTGLDMSLASAGLAPTPDTFWRGITSANCLDWASTSTSLDATGGNVGITSSSWDDFTLVGCETSTSFILCVCES